MRTTFNIRSDNFDHSDAQLFIEIAPQQVSMFVLSAGNCFNNFIAYSLPAPETGLPEIFDDKLVNGTYKKVTVIYTFPESILVPDTLMNETSNGDMLSLVFGPADGINKVDTITGKGISNVYRVPGSLSNIITEKFPGCGQYHQFSVLPNPAEGDTNLLCIFYNGGCTVRLQNKQGILFTNYFYFSTPVDIVYYLLSICKNFNIDIQQLNLIVAGLIEKDSILYKEIYKFFLQISFLEAPANYTCHEAFGDHQKYYFNHLFHIAACV